MIRFQSILSAIAILVCMSLYSCNEEGKSPENSEDVQPLITDVGTPDGEAISTSIGPAGGQITSPDSYLTITIPEGALDNNTSVSIQPITNYAPQGIGKGYRLGPENVQFKKPVSLSFHYDGNLIDMDREIFTWIVFQEKDKSWRAKLKSEVDTINHKITVETDHFSDWGLAYFVDLTITPLAKTVRYNEVLNLKVTGFKKIEQKPLNEEDLAPLVPQEGEGDILFPLNQFWQGEQSYQVKNWTLNGATAPASNSYGSLQANGRSATYTAPSAKPKPNKAVVSAELVSEFSPKSKFIINSILTIVPSDPFLFLTVDGQTYEYYQYGINGKEAPDQNNGFFTQAYTEDNILNIFGSQITDGMTISNEFMLQFKNPQETSRTLIQPEFEGEGDGMGFWPHRMADAKANNPPKSYVMEYYERSINEYESCDIEIKWTNASVIINTYDDTNGVAGSFSGTLYEDNETLEENCQSSKEHTITGEFSLIRVF